ncbi:hypothetical protein [Mycobacterium genavense]|uniref:hypothetical protein n=1 Tax=Mycobacterium genavense TaxID=36812 RepID=UPI00046F6D60|nr:hypothetical protein [Mycobacterium genavense]
MAVYLSFSDPDLTGYPGDTEWWLTIVTPYSVATASTKSTQDNAVGDVFQLEIRPKRPVEVSFAFGRH